MSLLVIEKPVHQIYHWLSHIWVFGEAIRAKNNDGIKDLDEHVVHMDTMPDYHQDKSLVKCKRFVLTLKWSSKT